MLAPFSTCFNIFKISCEVSELTSTEVTTALSEETPFSTGRLPFASIPLTTCFQSIQGAMKTCNDINFVTFMNIGATWLVRIPLAYVLVKYGNMGFYGLFLAFALDYVLRAVTFLYYVKKEHWYPLEKKI